MNPGTTARVRRASLRSVALRAIPPGRPTRNELAGHDPQQVLAEAVDGRSFDGLRNLSNGIYSRIRHDYADRLDPIGDSFTDWAPRVDNPEWATYLAALAETADQRAIELGQEAAEQAAPWAVEAFGPVPSQPDERTDWARQAGAVAAARELGGHADDADALGPAPKPGQVEAYAAYRAAWRTLGRPEIDREELEMSDGQLRVRVRAHDREATWAPRYVGNELAGTRQAAATHEQIAALRTAEAADASDPAERDRLHAEATQARALADTLTARAEELQSVDDARARWLAHTAGTRAAAERAKAELGARHVDDTEPEQQVTAQEWLAAHHADQRAEDSHRAIAETDVDDQTDQYVDDGMVDDGPVRTEQPDDTATQREPVEVPEPDVREVAAMEPAPVEEDVVRVPSADETARAIEDANRALIEMQAREAADSQAEEEHRAAELTRWHTDDQTAADGAEREVEMYGADDTSVDYDSGYEPAGS